MKKFSVVILASLMSLCSLFVTACKDDPSDTHVHNYTVTANNNGTHTKICSLDNSHVVTEDCSGGTATCTTKAHCSTCGAEYGTSLGHRYSNGVCGICGEVEESTQPHTHDYETVSNGDGTHTKTCKLDSTHKVTENCSGGSATCTKGAICSICESEYGKLSNHTYTNNICTSCGKPETNAGLEFTLINSNTSYEVSLGSCTDVDITIPSTYENLPVTKVAYEAFCEYSALKSITIPSSITCFENKSFHKCTSLERVEYLGTLEQWSQIQFGDGNDMWSITANPVAYSTNLYIDRELVTHVNLKSITKISDYAFYNLQCIKSVTIPSGVEKIGFKTFFWCKGLETVTLPNTVTELSSYAFYGCNNLKNLTLPNTIARIGDYAFYSCNKLQTLSLPTSLTSLGKYAFYSCIGLTEITFPSNLHYLGEYAFSKCNALTNLTIPGTIIDTGRYAFSYCANLTSVTLLNGVTKIDYSCFQNCTSLTNVVIPDSVEVISDYAFGTCSSLKSIIIPSSVQTMGTKVFRQCNDIKVYCRAATLPTHWSEDWDFIDESVYCTVEWGYTG